MPPEKTFTVDSTDASLASRNRVGLSPSTMVEMGLGIGDHVKIASATQLDTRGRQITSPSRNTDPKTSLETKYCYGIAWPSPSCTHSSTHFFFFFLH